MFIPCPTSIPEARVELQIDVFTNVSDLIVPQDVSGYIFGIWLIISGLTDIPLVIGAWKKINWVIYLWISLSHAQSVIICGIFFFFFPGIIAVCFVYMLIVSLIGFKLVKNNAVNKDTDGDQFDK